MIINNIRRITNNPKLSEKLVKLSADELSVLSKKIIKAIENIGVSCYVGVENGHLNLASCRLTDQYCLVYGRNKSNKGKQMRTTILGWDDWMAVDKELNKVLDEEKISAIVKSSFGIIRDGISSNYNNIEDRNVGSQFNPCYATEAYETLGTGRIQWQWDRKFKDEPSKFLEELKRIIQDNERYHINMFLGSFYLMKFVNEIEILCKGINNETTQLLLNQIEESRKVTIHRRKKKEQELAIVL